MNQLKFIAKEKSGPPACTARQLITGTVYLYGTSAYWMRTTHGAVLVADKDYPAKVGMHILTHDCRSHFDTYVEVCDATITITNP